MKIRRVGALAVAAALSAGVVWSASTVSSAAPRTTAPGLAGAVPAAAAIDSTRPASPVKLVFIHHSTGEAWLADDHGGLGKALRDNNYFTSDTNYGWGPDSIGDRTDIGNWWEWFRGPNSGRYLAALYGLSAQNCSYSRLARDPGGSNEIVMFKSCFPNSALKGPASAAVPDIAHNPLKGQSAGSSYHTVANAKGIYVDLLKYFETRQDELFVVICAPPLSDGTYAANARVFNNWLVNDWLAGYHHDNVFVFDFYDVLTSNGGDANTNDLGQAGGNHHRLWQGAIQHKTDGGSDTLAYPSSSGDDHPSAAGDKKATAELLPLLNVAYNQWRATAPPKKPRAILSRPSLSVASPRHGTRFRVSGTISPAHAATTTVSLCLWRRTRAGLRIYRRLTVQVATGATTYGARLKLASAGRWRIRAYHADADHRPSWSAARDFRVR